MTLLLTCPCTVEVEQAAVTKTIRTCVWREKGTATLTMTVQEFSSVAITIASAFTLLEVGSGMLRMIVVSADAHRSILAKSVGASV